MGNVSRSTRDAIALTNLGIRVDKAETALLGVSTKPIFTVAVGRVLVRALVGEVVIAVQDQSNGIKFVSTPTVGAATDMCAVGAGQNMGVGGLISLPGTSIATAAHVSATTAAGAVPGCNTAGIIVAAGTIGVNTAASGTGSMKFSIWYVPLDDGAYVTAV